MIQFFYGEDTFTLESELRVLRERFFKKNNLAAVEEIDADEKLAGQELTRKLQAVAENPGLFSREKLVILKNFLKNLKKFVAAEKYFYQILEAPPEQVTLILIETSRPDRRLSLFKALQKKAQTREFIVPTGKHLEKWIDQKLAAAGFKITRPALTRLIIHIGADVSLWRLDQELEKLKLFTLKKEIREQDIAAVVPESVSQDIFLLTNSVAQADRQTAARLLEVMLTQEAMPIVGALAAQLRSLLLVRDLESLPVGEIAKRLSWKEGRVWINQKLAKKFSAARLRQLLQDLKALDFRLKTSDEPPKVLLTLFFEKMAK